MKRLKLTDLVREELNSTEMMQIRGGGCTSNCGKDVKVNADQAIKNVKKNALVNASCQ